MIRDDDDGDDNIVEGIFIIDPFVMLLISITRILIVSFPKIDIFLRLYF